MPTKNTSSEESGQFDESSAALTRSILRENAKPIDVKIEAPEGTILTGERDYEIIEPVGKGGMGAVFTAKPLDEKAIANGTIEPVVAIKIFSPEAQMLDHLDRREIGMLKSLRHPNIVSMYDTGSYGDARFAAIRYCSNGSIQDMLLKGRIPPSSEVLKILIHILNALVGTHSCGILHLDIKPANILADEDGNYLLTDFGAARTLFQQDHRYLLGTPFFMSPEQARGEIDLLDARSDLFSLAATLWLLMYPENKIDFKYSDLQKTRKKDSFPLLVDVVDEIDQPLAKLIDRMLMFNAHNRPGSVAEVLIEAHRIAGTEHGTPQIAEAVPGEPIDDKLRNSLKDYMSDSIILELLTGDDKFYTLRMYEQGDLICVEDSLTFDVFILLHGKVEVIRSGRLLFEEVEEGTILGEVSALAGQPRTASLRANGDVILAVMNASELEQAARRMPALSVRIMKHLARRLIERDQLEE